MEKYIMSRPKMSKKQKVLNLLSKGENGHGKL